MRLLVSFAHIFVGLLILDNRIKSPWCSEGCLVWNMWLPSINQTVVKTVEQAGYTVAKVGRIEYWVIINHSVFRYHPGTMASYRGVCGTLLMDLQRRKISTC